MVRPIAGQEYEPEFTLSKFNILITTKYCSKMFKVYQLPLELRKWKSHPLCPFKREKGLGRGAVLGLITS